MIFDIICFYGAIQFNFLEVWKQNVKSYHNLYAYFEFNKLSKLTMNKV